MEKIRTIPFPPYNALGEEEVAAAAAVVRSGLLSDFLGSHSDKFRGGKHVRELEQRWAEYHHVKHAISFNSASSALIAGIGALGIMPGDEVLVIGYSMCISATAPLFYDAIPVFVDLEDDYYCMDPDRIEASITPRTRAILPVDLFGQSSDMERINEIARKYKLSVLCDASHVPGCRYLDGFAGACSDIGVFSLNQHKIIHCGEAGIAVTNDDELALKLQLLRNHGEAVVEAMGVTNLVNIVGGNLRLPEMEAAIAIEQLKKLPTLLKQRRDLAEYLTEHLGKLDFLIPPKVRAACTHAYYVYPIRYQQENTGISREAYVQNIRDLGIPLHRFAAGYIRPLYLEPIFARRQEFKRGFPYNLAAENDRPSYAKGICPVTERLHEKEMIVTAYNYPPLTFSDMDDIIKAFTHAALMK